MAKCKGLTKKQKTFCEEYIANGYNATQAYLKAYDCQYDSARVEGSKALKKPMVKEYIAALQKEAFEGACITAERIALKLGDIAFANKTDEHYTPQAQLKALDLLQKQLSLQHQHIEANVVTDINIVIDE